MTGVSMGHVDTVILAQDALTAIQRAAAGGRFAIVPHSLTPDALGSPAQVRALTLAMPKQWTSVVDGAVDPLAGVRPKRSGAVDAPATTAPTVTRLYHLQRSVEVRPVIDAVYAELAAGWPAAEPWIETDAGIFASTPGAVTAAHVDLHHNLLIQLNGRKTIGVAVAGSRAHAAVVAAHTDRMVDTMPAGADTVELLPGFAMYLPPYSVHWVRSLDPALALSCAWSTANTLHLQKIYDANAILRRIGLPARPVGGGTDNLKIHAVAAARRVRYTFRR